MTNSPIGMPPASILIQPRPAPMGAAEDSCAAGSPPQGRLLRSHVRICSSYVRRLKRFASQIMGLRIRLPGEQKWYTVTRIAIAGIHCNRWGGM